MSKRHFACVVCLLLGTASLLVPTVASLEYPAGWEAAVLIETNDPSSTTNQDVAIDDSGNAIAAWREGQGSTYEIWANRYVKGVGWGDSVAISETGYQFSAPAVAVDSDGSGLAVWNQYDADSSTQNIWMNYYEVGVGWTGMAIVEDENEGHAWDPKVTADPSGRFFIIWHQSDGSLHNVHCKLYDPDSGLGDLWVLDDSETEDAWYTDIGTDSSGCAMAIWKESFSSPHRILSCRYEPESGWGAPVQVGGHVRNGYPVLSIEPGGNATCAWQHQNATGYYEIYGNYYASDSGWDSQTLLRWYVSANVMNPSVASIEHGRSIVAWVEWGGGSYNSICSVEYDSSSGWGDVIVAAHSDDGIPSLPSVASSFNDDAILVYSISLSSLYNEVWATPYSAEEGWGQQERLSAPDLGDAKTVVVCMNRNGDATAVWLQSNGVRDNVWASSKPGPDTTPPPLSISQPSDGETVEVPFVDVEGVTEPGASLSVAGLQVSVEADGSFSVSLALSEGENVITAVATDASGNSVSVSITVIYEAPANPLDDVVDDLLVLIEDLNQTLDELTVSLDEMQDELNGTLTDLDDANDALADAEERLGDANSRIDGLSSNLGLLTALTIVVCVLLGVFSLMYNRLKTEIRGKGVEPSDDEPPTE